MTDFSDARSGEHDGMFGATDGQAASLGRTSAGRNVSVAVSIAHFSRLRDRDDAPGGIELGFLARPETGFDPVFRRFATPLPHAVLSAGHTLIGGPDKGRGAWMVRFGGEYAYLVHLRQNRDLAPGGVIDGAPPERQKAHLEQITFRFARADWADHAPSLFDAALDRVVRPPQGSRAVDSAPFDLRPTGEASEPWSTKADAALSVVMSAPKVPLVLTGDTLPDAGPVAVGAVLAALPPRARNGCAIVWNWIGRVPGAAVQIFPHLKADSSPADRDSALEEATRWYAERLRIARLDLQPTLGTLLDAAHQHVTAGSHPPFGGNWAAVRRALLGASSGVALALDYADLAELRHLSRVLDAAIDLAGDRADLRSACIALWDRFVGSVCAALPQVPARLLADMGAQDHAPVLLSELMDQPTPLAERLLGEVWLLRNAHREEYDLLVGRMPVPTRFLPTTWGLLMTWDIVADAGKAISAVPAQATAANAAAVVTSTAAGAQRKTAAHAIQRSRCNSIPGLRPSLSLPPRPKTIGITADAVAFRIKAMMHTKAAGSPEETDGKPHGHRRRPRQLHPRPMTFSQTRASKTAPPPKGRALHLAGFWKAPRARQTQVPA